MSLKVFTVVGARPQFIKAAPVARAIRRAGLDEAMVHTGQHYDWEMSAVFFERLHIPAPRHFLGVGSATHGAQTGRMLERLEEVLSGARPDLVLVYGDTNSTLAGALAAAKLNIPVAHVEAGLRDYDRSVPEELNRRLTDHLSSLLFVPTELARRNLEKEGIADGVVWTGDVMYDAVLLFRDEIDAVSESVLSRFGLERGRYVFATVHRAENTNVTERWQGIAEGIRRAAVQVGPVLWAAHPRTRALVESLNLPGVRIVEPVPYFETQALLMHARVVLTDSGGIQREAAFNEVPCVILRERTPWQELISSGASVLAGVDPGRIAEAALRARWPSAGLPPGVFGDGHGSEIVARCLSDFLHGDSALSVAPIQGG